jgi:hypothetical protein
MLPDAPGLSHWLSADKSGFGFVPKPGQSVRRSSDRLASPLPSQAKARGYVSETPPIGVVRHRRVCVLA